MAAQVPLRLTPLPFPDICFTYSVLVSHLLLAPLRPPPSSETHGAASEEWRRQNLPWDSGQCFKFFPWTLATVYNPTTEYSPLSSSLLLSD